MIDWAATGSMMSGFAAWAGVAAVVYAAHKAANTFGAFRRQKVHERKMATAEDVLTLGYKVRRNLTAIRSPMQTGPELAAAHEKLAEQDWYQALTQDEQRLTQTSQSIKTRIFRYQSDWDRIFDLMPRARALLGEEIENDLQSLWQQVHRVNISADFYSDRVMRESDQRTQIERDIWDHGNFEPETNRVAIAVEAAIDDLEQRLLPILRSDD